LIFAWAWPWTFIFLISASWVARIIDMSHRCPAYFLIGIKFFSFFFPFLFFFSSYCGIIFFQYFKKNHFPLFTTFYCFCEAVVLTLLFVGSF
jgi:hypothetical protein